MLSRLSILYRAIGTVILGLDAAAGLPMALAR